MQITVIGLGINPHNDLSLLAYNTLKNANKSIVITTDDDVFQLNNLGIFPENIMDLYMNGNIDADNYEHIFEKILKEAEINSNLVVGLPGNPGFGVTLLLMLRERQIEHSYELFVLPGISSLDWMMLANAHDPLERGTIVLDANRLLLFDFSIDPTLDCYIYHVCSVGTARTWINEPDRDNNIPTLKEFLLKVYPPEHIVSLISIKSALLRSTTDPSQYVLAKSTIERMEEMLSVVHFDATLFIEGVNPKKINRDFLDFIRSR